MVGETSCPGQGNLHVSCHLRSLVGPFRSLPVIKSVAVRIELEEAAEVRITESGQEDIQSWANGVRKTKDLS